MKIMGITGAILIIYIGRYMYLNKHNADENPNAWHDKKAVDCKMLNIVRLSSFFVGLRPFINRVSY